MSCYQKFYSNQIHSSSLMCQLATMWKSQVLCDAIIRTGSIITKAHRLVLVAACPMLQSMENASMGSHLEVRLAPDIKQDSVNTFLQYLYEGFMMLTEENCKDVEKIARLLQVDSIIKCVSDFYKCLSAKTGCHIDDRYKYSSYDLLEFKHIRASSIQKTLHEAALKRGSDFSRPLSPGNKRQRLHRPPSPSDSRLSHRADDTHSMAHSYTQGGQLRDPWDARGRGGARVPPQPGVIDIVEDSIEIIQSDQSDKADGHVKQKSVSVGVTSQYNTATDVRVVSVNDSGGTGTLHSSGAKTHDSQQSTITNSSARGSITVSPLPMFDTSSSPTSVNRNSDSQMDIPSVRPTPPSQPVFPTLTPMPKQPVPILPKPFAAGSASQASSSPSSEAKSSSPANVDHTEKREMANKDDVISEDGTTPDLKIVKIESNDSLTGGLDMYVDRGEDNILRLQGMEDCQNEDGSDVEHDQSLDWSKEEMSNEGSNVSTDQNNSWYIDQFKASCPIGPKYKVKSNEKTSLALEEIGIPNSSQHYLVKLVGTKKLCEHCKRNRLKSKGGWWVYTRYMCNECSIPLCNGKQCLFEYHKRQHKELVTLFGADAKSKWLKPEQVLNIPAETLALASKWEINSGKTNELSEEFQYLFE